MITTSQAIHKSWSAITHYISWPQFGVSALKAHLRGDGIDLRKESGSSNKQQDSDFKDEETHLYFSPGGLTSGYLSGDLDSEKVSHLSSVFSS